MRTVPIDEKTIRRREQQRLASERWRSKYPDRARQSKNDHKKRAHQEREIIAIDSEGVNVDDGSHQLVLIGSDTGDIEYNRSGTGLGTERILDKLLLPLLMRNRNAIFVSFGFDYDTRMIFRDISAVQWEAIKANRSTKIFGRKYNVTWTKKQLSIKFLKVPGKPCITIYDVTDFFGGTFVDAVRTHLSSKFNQEDEADFAKVVAGKENREHFKLEDFDDIFEYWAAEIRFMAPLVETVRDLVIEYFGICITKWNALTQITRFMLDKYKASEFMQPAPDWVPVDDAFFGGRIEAFVVGHVNQEVWDYDENGAHGYALKWLPDLTTGKWVEIGGSEFNWTRDYKPFGIYEVEYESWDIGSVLPQPLPVRHGESILYPTLAHTFVWGPEAWMVRNDITVVKAWIYEDDGVRPLAALADELWDIRMRARTDNSSIEKIVKQVLARVSGKFCQSFGTETDYFTGEVTTPKYRRLEYSGFINSLTRAQVYEAMRIAIEAGGKIFNCNTDGFTTDADIGMRLARRHGFGDGLGEWKARKYEDLVVIETNMYLLKNFPAYADDKEWVVKKAGYGSGYRVTFEDVMIELSREDIWDKDAPMVFEGVQFDDVTMQWVPDYKVRHLGGRGKRIHTRNCWSCQAGLSPSDAPHTLTPRKVPRSL